MPVAGGTGIVDAAGVQVQGGSQGEGAVADVVVGAGGGAAGGRGQARPGAFQGLHPGFFVEAQSHDVGRAFFS